MCTSLVGKFSCLPSINPPKKALLRVVIMALYFLGGGTMGGDGPTIQVCTSLVSWWQGPMRSSIASPKLRWQKGLEMWGCQLQFLYLCCYRLISLILHWHHLTSVLLYDIVFTCSLIAIVMGTRFGQFKALSCHCNLRQVLILMTKDMKQLPASMCCYMQWFNPSVLACLL